MQSKRAEFDEQQKKYFELTTEMIQELGYSQNLPRMRNLVTECSDEISLLTKIAQDQF